MQRSYRKVRGEGNNIVPGDILEIRINFDVRDGDSPLGAYTITDYLPAGLIFIRRPGLYGLEGGYGVTSNDDNIVRYTFYNSPWWQKNGEREIVYYAIASSVGKYVAEPCVIQSQMDLSVIGITSEEEIEIKNEN